jgi:hypothetical protein
MGPWSSYHLWIVLDLICITHPPIQNFPPTHKETTQETFPSVQKLPNQVMALLTSLQTPSDFCFRAIKNNLPLIKDEIYKCRNIECSGYTHRSATENVRTADRLLPYPML